MTLIAAVSASRRRQQAASQLSILELPNMRVYQRAASPATSAFTNEFTTEFEGTSSLSTQSANIQLSGSYSGTPSAVQVRVIKASDSSETVPWTTIAASPTGGLWSGSISTPHGGWYKIEARFSAAPATITSTTNLFGVGDIWMFTGESQQARMSALVASPPTSDSRAAYFNGTSWFAPGDQAGTSGNGGRRFLNLMVENTGVPQAMIQASVEGTSIVDWEAADAAYTNARDKLLAAGSIAGILWHQGGTGIGVVTPDDYKTRLADLKTRFETAANVARFAVFPLMHRTKADETDAAVQEIRRAHFEYLAANPSSVNLGWTPAMPMADEVNQTSAGSEIIAYAYAHALLFKMGIATINNVGPSITGVTRSGVTLTLTVQHVSGTALKTNTGMQPTGFQVLPRGTTHSDAAALTISSITLGSNTISIELAADPQQAVDVYYQYGKFDNSNPVFDNSAALGKTDGNALKPLMAPVQSAAEFKKPSLQLNGTDTWIRYLDSALWDLPDADWTMGIFMSLTSNAASGSQSTQYAFSGGAHGGVNTFNFLVYEASAGSGNANRYEFVIRGAGASSIVVKGAADLALVDQTWRLWVVEFVKATETINIYHCPTGGARTLYATASAVGLGAVLTATGPAIGTRAPPVVASGLYLNGAVYEFFKLNALLTAGEVGQIAAGKNIRTDLGKTTQVHSRLNTLATPIPDASGSGVSAALNGTITIAEGPPWT